MVLANDENHVKQNGFSIADISYSSKCKTGKKGKTVTICSFPVKRVKLSQYADITSYFMQGQNSNMQFFCKTVNAVNM